MSELLWCVWSLLPNRSGPDGWSRVAGELTQEQAQWYASVSLFPSTSMPDQAQR